MPKKIVDLESHFFSKIEKNQETGCWLWQKGFHDNGYGKFCVNRLPLYAHRWSYEHHKGPIPEGLVIDHLCSNHACVNPDHLEAVTPKVNVSRNKLATSTHCKQGHPYEEPPYRGWNGRRRCRICDYEQAKKRRISTPSQPKTHCKRGHPFDEKNTYYEPRGWRACRACKQASLERARRGIKPSPPIHCPHGHPYDEKNTGIYQTGKKKGKRYCRECARISRRRHSLKSPRTLQRYSSLEWKELKRQYNYTCLCCGKQEPEIKLTVDHVVPITKGGSKYISNIQPLCKLCNLKKRTEIIDYRPAYTAARQARFEHGKDRAISIR